MYGMMCTPPDIAAEYELDKWKSYQLITQIGNPYTLIAYMQCNICHKQIGPVWPKTKSIRTRGKNGCCWECFGTKAYHAHVKSVRERKV